MIRTQVYLPEDLHGQLMLLAKMQGTNYSSLVREGVSNVVGKKRQSRTFKNRGAKFVGACPSGGPRNLSSRIDYYLYGEGRK